MSVQFGRWNFDGKPVDRDYLRKVRSLLSPYGPDASSSYARGGTSILYHAFHTTKESRCEKQPYFSRSGAVITWDGRLDNRLPLIKELRDVLNIYSTDVAIVAASYEKWNTDCFARLLGDWAMAIWKPLTGSLILAKDFVGARHLYYSFDRDQVTWSTILDPLVLFSETKIALSEEYIAGWLSSFPAAHLTPYVGIQAVAASTFVLLHAAEQRIQKYWDFDPSRKVRYPTDGEYEEHFRTVFEEAVRRRLRSDSPILAELSGGMDSSSIVCVADKIIARSGAECPRVDTLSYFNDSEPNWNERPYFSKVEEQRGRTGYHIDVGSQESCHLDLASDHLEIAPGYFARPPIANLQYAACLTSQGNRVVLSGMGGDEATGGVPTPLPELEDLLSEFRLRELAHKLKVWALNKREPWIHLFFAAARGFLPPAVVGVSKYQRPLPWLDRDFAKRHRAALHGYDVRLKLFGAAPSFQENISTLHRLRRHLACDALPSEPTREMRFPFLDRDFLEFIYAIPREQLIRPGERRSLLRRALLGIVPSEILNRRRKGLVSKAPRIAISMQWAKRTDRNRCMLTASLGIVDQQRFAACMHRVRHDPEVPILPLMRTLSVEFWLRNLYGHGILPDTNHQSARAVECLAPNVISAEEI